MIELQKALDALKVQRARIDAAIMALCRVLEEYEAPDTEQEAPAVAPRKPVRRA